MKIPPKLSKYLISLDDCDAGFGDSGEVTVNSRSRVMDTPLHWAAISGEEDIGRLLLEAGADVNAQGEGGYTPLHEAIAHKRIGFLKLLLEYGADLSIDSDSTSTESLLDLDDEVSKLTQDNNLKKTSPDAPLEK